MVGFTFACVDAADAFVLALTRLSYGVENIEDPANDTVSYLLITTLVYKQVKKDPASSSI